MSSKKVLERTLVDLVDKLHREQPKAPIFGPIQPGKLQAPVEDWKKYLKAAVKGIKGTPVLGDNSCWKRKSNQIKPYLPKEKGVPAPKSVQVTRLLVYLRNPTDANWAKLSSGDLNTPFDHFCNQGQSDADGCYCINGLEHGAFTTRNMNEDRKKCTYGARCLCRHDPKCIFTDKVNGRVLPCLMNETHVPVCAHAPRCY